MSLQKLLFATLLLPAILSVSCQRKAIVSDGATVQNSPQTLKKPYLFLISLDGFRQDYVERFQPPNLKKFISSGVKAESLLSCYPSKTFTNHYTIATGMYPDHHGLVDNSFYDKTKDATYRMGARELVEDGTWYGGTPIWVQAARSGMVTASYFFVGSEAAVQGIHPTYYHRYDGAISNDTRVEQALNWLALPEKERPHFIAMYFSDMDDVGHRHGPNADEKLREAVLPLDASLGRLFEGIEKTGLPVNIIIVSDHGMAPIQASNLLPSEQLEDAEHYLTVHSGALAHLYLKEGADAEAVYRDLKAKEKHFKVYRTKETPYFEVLPTNSRWGDYIVVPDSNYYFASARSIGSRKTAGVSEIGEHGMDPNRREMQGIFYAKGPNIKPGLTVPSFRNIHVYPLMCEILGLKVPAEVDGRIEVLKGILKSNRQGSL